MKRGAIKFTAHGLAATIGLPEGCYVTGIQTRPVDHCFVVFVTGPGCKEYPEASVPQWEEVQEICERAGQGSLDLDEIVDSALGPNETDSAKA